MDRKVLGRPIAFLGPWTRALLDLLFPPRCQVCGAPDEFPLCRACWQGFPRIEPPVCPVCGRPLVGPPDLVFTCMPCRRKRPLIRVRAFGRYDGRLREAIHALKYGRNLALADPLGTALAQVVCGDPVLRTADALVPVPLHPRRWSERGFNQAEELARVAARRTGIPLRHLVVRVRPTVPQTELDEEERRRNVRGAFAVRGAATGLRVIVVDDVVTTGSTLRECARALRRAGARDVSAAVVALAVRDP